MTYGRPSAKDGKGCRRMVARFVMSTEEGEDCTRTTALLEAKKRALEVK